MAAFTLAIAPVMLPVTSMTKATSIGPHRCCEPPPSDDPPPPPPPEDPPSGDPTPPGVLPAPASTTDSTVTAAHRAPVHEDLPLRTRMVHPVGAPCLQRSAPDRTSGQLSSGEALDRSVPCSKRCAPALASSDRPSTA